MNRIILFDEFFLQNWPSLTLWLSGNTYFSTKLSASCRWMPKVLASKKPLSPQGLFRVPWPFLWTLKATKRPSFLLKKKSFKSVMAFFSELMKEESSYSRASFKSFSIQVDLFLWSLLRKHFEKMIDNGLGFLADNFILFKIERILLSSYYDHWFWNCWVIIWIWPTISSQVHM